MKRAGMLAVLVACGTSPATGSSDDTTSTTSSTAGGATWQDVPSTSDPSTSGGSTSGAVESTESSTGPESSSGEGAESTTTTGDPATSSSGPDPASSSDTIGPDPTCEEMSCADCALCVVAPGGACNVQANACQQAQGCVAAAQCLGTCGVKGLCLDNCCEDLSQMSASLALALNDCAAEACEGTCVDWNQGFCQ